MLAIACISLLIVLAFGGGPQAADSSSTSDDDPTSTSPPQLPTEVHVAGYLIGLSRVSEPSEPFPTYEVEMFLDLSWKDPRLALDGQDPRSEVFLGEEAVEKLSEIWSPDLEIENEVEQRSTESVELRILPDGVVEYEERFGAVLNAELDLHEFPFDRQTLDIEMQSFVWDMSEVSLTVNEAQTGFDPDFETPEWTVTAVEGLVGVRSEVRDDREFSSSTFRIHARRHSGHYLLRLLLPLFFVMTLTWCAFWEPALQRFEVGFISLLTVVAIHTVIAKGLPRLNYLTIADAFLIVCYLVSTALIITSLIVRRIEQSGDHDRAERIDRRMRLWLPIASVLALTVTTLILWN